MKPRGLYGSKHLPFDIFKLLPPHAEDPAAYRRAYIKFRLNFDPKYRRERYDAQNARREQQRKGGTMPDMTKGALIQAAAWLVTGGRTYVDWAFMDAAQAGISVINRNDGAIVEALYREGDFKSMRDALAGVIGASTRKEIADIRIGLLVLGGNDPTIPPALDILERTAKE